MRRAVLTSKQRRLVLVALAVIAAAGLPAGSPAGTGPASTLLAPLADTESPSVPQGMAFSGRTGTTVSLVWRAATDNVGVVGYRLFKNGRAVSTVPGLRHTYRGLGCGTSYTFALEAYDAAGNASYRPEAVGRISTLRCGTTAKPTPVTKPKTPVQAPKTKVPATGRAHLWIDVNGGSCSRAATPSAYADGRACGSLAAAYGPAQPGDTVVVAAGTYGPQHLRRGTKAVTFRNAPGSRPVLSTTNVEASNLTVVGFTIKRNDDVDDLFATLEARGDDNTYVDIHVDTLNRPVRQGIHAGGDRNVFRGGSSVNVIDEKGVLIGGSNVTFDNYVFRDVIVTNSAVHNECVFSNGPNVTIRNSRFFNCATMALYITRGDWWGQPLYGGVTIVNNVFGHSTMPGAGTWHYYGLVASGVLQEMRNWRVTNNTFETAVGVDLPAPGTIWANNIGTWNCVRGATFSGNVGKKCAASDKAVSPAASCGRPACASPVVANHHWIAPERNDFHLAAGSPAIGAADPTYAPARDRDGRPRVGRPDAGAYEHYSR